MHHIKIEVSTEQMRKVSEVFTRSGEFDTRAEFYETVFELGLEKFKKEHPIPVGNTRRKIEEAEVLDSFGEGSYTLLGISRRSGYSRHKLKKIIARLIEKGKLSSREEGSRTYYLKGENE